MYTHNAQIKEVILQKQMKPTAPKLNILPEILKRQIVYYITAPEYKQDKYEYMDQIIRTNIKFENHTAIKNINELVHN